MPYITLHDSIYIAPIQCLLITAIVLTKNMLDTT